MQREPVVSSVLGSVGSENGMLEIEFVGGDVRYFAIPAQLHADLMAASPAGRSSTSRSGSVPLRAALSDASPAIRRPSLSGSGSGSANAASRSPPAIGRKPVQPHGSLESNWKSPSRRLQPGCPLGTKTRVWSARGCPHSSQSGEFGTVGTDHEAVGGPQLRDSSAMAAGPLHREASAAPAARLSAPLRVAADERHGAERECRRRVRAEQSEACPRR